MGRYRLMLALLLLSLASCSSTAVSQMEPVVEQKRDALAVREAWHYLQQHRQSLQLENPQAQLSLVRSESDFLGFHHLRFQQHLDGVPVWGKEIVLHLNRTDKVYRVSGRGVVGLSFSSEPTLDQEAIAKRAVTVMPGGLNVWKVKQAKLYFYAPWQNGAKLVYQVELHRGLIRQFLLLDAHDGSLIKRIAGTPSIY